MGEQSTVSAERFSSCLFESMKRSSRKRHQTAGAVAQACIVFAAVAAMAAAASNQTTARLTVQDVKNADVCLPSLGDGPGEIVRLRNGTYQSTSIPFAEVRAVGAGQLDGRPAVVAEIVWNTGGSGNWEIVALFRKVNGRVTSEGIYSPGSDLPDGGTMVNRIEITGDKVYLYGSDPLHNRSISTPLVVRASAFAPCLAAGGP